jgi:hypothetical protein
MTIMLLQGFLNIYARDINLSGVVRDETGASVSNAKVSFFINSTGFAAVTGYDGRYSVRVSGTYSDVAGQFEAGQPFPNPFTYSVNIPFIINTKSDLLFSVYNLSGQKIREIFFPDVYAGSYRIIWDGCNQGGSPQRPGLYFYSVTFRGRTYGGRIVKSGGISSYAAPSGLESVMMPPESAPAEIKLRFPVISEVTKTGYYPVRLTDITIARDTVIDFTLASQQPLPFKVSGSYIAMHALTGYRSLILKGMNLGSSPPGYFPGEIAYAISPELYEQWIERMGEAGFNSIRVYTLHPPVFYEKLAEYNQRHPDAPLLLFQGVWLEEQEDPWDPSAYDLTNRITSFSREIEEVIDCIHGNGDLAYKPGKAYGKYRTDMSRWTAGIIIGREVSSQEVDSTDLFHPSSNSFSGSQFSITGATPTEVFVTRMLDKVVSYEASKYSVRRPVSFSSWPTLDPLDHPTETLTDEDVASFDISKISGADQYAGLFASYHAYPYYPNFISQQPSYQAYSDSYGPDSYLGYLTDLKNHYDKIPLVIAEYGVPSSWGSAHQSFSEMHHGGYSETQQGEKNIRMLNNMIDAGCAGGFMFSWMDEWFKRTWIVLYLEAYGLTSGSEVIPTRQLWHNETSPEQNFGLLAFDQRERAPYESYTTDNPSGPLSNIRATQDESFFYLEILSAENLTGSDDLMIAFDTYLDGTGEGKLPNGQTIANRAEFMISVPLADDTALYHVTEAYDMNGLTVRFNLTDPSVQKYKSTVTDGAPWKVMQWINDGNEMTSQDIGRLPLENATTFDNANRAAVVWSGNKLNIRIPWTMLYFNDPTQMKVNDGAISYDGGYNFDIITSSSDGIAVSVFYKGVVTNTTNRYRWPLWLVVPPTKIREKASLEIVEQGMSEIPGFIN